MKMYILIGISIFNRFPQMTAKLPQRLKAKS